MLNVDFDRCRDLCSLGYDESQKKGLFRPAANARYQEKYQTDKDARKVLC